MGIMQNLIDGDADIQSFSNWYEVAGKNDLVPRRLNLPIKPFAYYKDELDSAVAQFGAEIAKADALVATNQANAITAVNQAIEGVAIDANLVTDALIKTVPKMGGIARNQAAKNAEQVSVKDFGALGDGTGATVVHWYTAGSLHYRNYADLAAVQVDYPHVTSSADTIDWASCQAAVLNSRRVHAPAGTYVFNKPVRTNHSLSFFNADSGITFYGDGMRTVFTRGDAAVATRALITDTNAVKLAADQANANEACFNFHGSNNDFHGFRIVNSRIGIYLGQDYSKSTDESVCHNNTSRITFSRCGVGYMSACSQGNHYNNCSDLHFVQCQIDAYLKAGGRWTNPLSNNNRNTFSKICSARGRVGLWIESGDTNTIYDWHGEGCGQTAFENPFPVPSGLPGGIKSGVHIIGGQSNRVFGSHMENNQVELYNYGYANEYYGNGYHEDTPDGTAVIAATPFGAFISSKTLYTTNISDLSNTNQLAFPNVSFGVTLKGTTLNLNNRIIKKKSSTTAKTYDTSESKELGAIAANTSVDVELWANGAANESGHFVVTVLGITTSDRVASSAKFTVLASRNSTGGLFADHIIAGDTLRAAGENEGDSLEKITATVIRVGAALKLRVKAAQFRDLTSCSVRIEGFFNK